MARKKSKARFDDVVDVNVNCPNQGFEPKTRVLSTFIFDPGGTGTSGNWTKAVGVFEDTCVAPLLVGIGVVWVQPPIIIATAIRLAAPVCNGIRFFNVWPLGTFVTSNGLSPFGGPLSYSTLASVGQPAAAKCACSWPTRCENICESTRIMKFEPMGIMISNRTNWLSRYFKHLSEFLVSDKVNCLAEIVVAHC